MPTVAPIRPEGVESVEERSIEGLLGRAAAGGVKQHPLSAATPPERRIEIKRLQRQFGLTTVLATRDQDEVMGVAHRIAVITTDASSNSTGGFDG